MIPVRLRIEGFLSYREPVELDFTGFHLACISGPNGRGNPPAGCDHLGAVWPRPAEQRSGNQYASEVKAAESRWILTTKATAIRSSAPPKGKTSSVEFRIRTSDEGKPEKWKPLTERTLRETDARIVSTLRMDYDTFTNASFFCRARRTSSPSPGRGTGSRSSATSSGWKSGRPTVKRRESVGATRRKRSASLTAD